MNEMKIPALRKPPFSRKDREYTHGDVPGSSGCSEGDVKERPLGGQRKLF